MRGDRLKPRQMGLGDGAARIGLPREYQITPDAARDKNARDKMRGRKTNRASCHCPGARLCRRPAAAATSGGRREIFWWRSNGPALRLGLRTQPRSAAVARTGYSRDPRRKQTVSHDVVGHQTAAHAAQLFASPIPLPSILLPTSPCALGACGDPCLKFHSAPFPPSRTNNCATQIPPPAAQLHFFRIVAASGALLAATRIEASGCPAN